MHYVEAWISRINILVGANIFDRSDEKHVEKRGIDDPDTIAIMFEAFSNSWLMKYDPFLYDPLAIAGWPNFTTRVYGFENLLRVCYLNILVDRLAI